MTDSKNDKRGKSPTHIAYQVSGEGPNAFWMRIGSAWQNADGKGINIQLDSVPLSGRIVVRTIADKKD